MTDKKEPTIKLTAEDLAPRKGIYRRSLQTEDMPADANGNPVESIMSDDEIFRRTPLLFAISAGDHDGEVLLPYRWHVSKPKRVRGLGQRKSCFTRYHI